MADSKAEREKAERAERRAAEVAQRLATGKPAAKVTPTAAGRGGQGGR